MMSAIGALLLADADRLMRHGQRGRRDVRRGAARAPTSRSPPPTSWPGRIPARSRSPPSCATCCGTARSRPATTPPPTRSRTRTRCAACRRSTAPCATPSTTCGASSTSSSTRRPTTRSSSRAAASPSADTLATGGGRVISGGNFHGEPIALALDFAKLALAELGSISERRSALLVDARLNGGLPPFLAASSGIDSGMMIYQYTAAALASEHKVLAHPASVDSIPTSANQEDHVSMGSIAARHARTVLAGRRADRGHRAAPRRAGARPAAGAAWRGRPRASVSRRRWRGSARGSTTWTRIASRVRTWPPPRRIVHDGEPGGPALTVQRR